MKNTIKSGFEVQSYHKPVKRFCQTLYLRNNPDLIAEYRKRHDAKHVW